MDDGDWHMVYLNREINKSMFYKRMFSHLIFMPMFIIPELKVSFKRIDFFFFGRFSAIKEPKNRILNVTFYLSLNNYFG